MKPSPYYFLILLTGLLLVHPTAINAINRLSDVSLIVEETGELPPNFGIQLPVESTVLGNNTQTDQLVISSYAIDAFNADQVPTDNEDALTTEISDSETLSEPVQVVGKMLNYPNPFRFKTTGTTIRYQLNQDAPVELRVYDPFANEILRESYAYGQNGGKGNQPDYTNEIIINPTSFNTSNIPSGIYFYLLLHENTVLAKGKMAVIP